MMSTSKNLRLRTASETAELMAKTEDAVKKLQARGLVQLRRLIACSYREGASARPPRAESAYGRAQRLVSHASLEVRSMTIQEHSAPWPPRVGDYARRRRDDSLVEVIDVTGPPVHPQPPDPLGHDA